MKCYSFNHTTGHIINGIIKTKIKKFSAPLKTNTSINLDLLEQEYLIKEGCIFADNNNILYKLSTPTVYVPEPRQKAHKFKLPTFFILMTQTEESFLVHFAIERKNENKFILPNLYDSCDNNLYYQINQKLQDFLNLLSVYKVCVGNAFLGLSLSDFHNIAHQLVHRIISASYSADLCFRSVYFKDVYTSEYNFGQFFCFMNAIFELSTEKQEEFWEELEKNGCIAQIKTWVQNNLSNEVQKFYNNIEFFLSEE